MYSLLSLPILYIVMNFYNFNSFEETQSKVFNYNIEINNLDGKKIDLNQFKGKKILFVNTASMCGFTKQYKELENLYKEYNENLVIIASPSNQFGGQEPGTNFEIKQFCEKNFGVTFLITEKINVKGSEIHPLYSWLTSKEKNGVKNSSVKWNFQKYFVDESGYFIDYFYSTTSPYSSKILKLINN